MKPLTIEELKALKAGDWLWVKSKIGDIVSGYYMVDFLLKDPVRYIKGDMVLLSVDRTITVIPNDYGTQWLAYKNKEQAEAKGEIVELPCIREVFKKNKPTYRVFFLRDDNFIDSYAEWTEEEAERRLAELKGEKV